MALDVPMSKAAEKAAQMRPKIEVDPRYAEILTHMLGAGSHIPKGQHGYRNHFCAGIGTDDHKLLLEMEPIGLVKASTIINDGRDQYFVATLLGCRFIGLSEAAIERAIRAPRT